MVPPPIRIIGIDPGLRTTGWGIIEAQGSRLSFIACGCVRSDDKLSTAARLRQLHEGLSEIIAAHAPHAAAVEETFVNRDPQSAVKLAHARGISLAVRAVARVGVADS